MKKKIWISICVLLLGAAWFLVWGIDLIWDAPMPKVDRAACLAVKTAEMTGQDGVRMLGTQYAFTREGVDACFLEGAPEVRGAAMARLYAEKFAAVERSLIETVEHFIPYAAVRWLMSRLVLVRNRDLDRFVPDEIQAELAGLVLASKDHYPQYGDYFNRLLNYLAAHDISHAYMDYMFMACTAFGLSAAQTADHSTLLARNFDFEAGSAFDVNKLVMLIRPEQGQPFISVAWPGMVGVVSGMNAAGIGVVLLAGHSQDKPDIGTPVSVVARLVLSQAETLDAAVDIIRKADVFVSESFLVGSGREDRFVVVEKTPQQTVVRGMEGDRIIAANHFLSPEFSGDKANLDYQAEGTSVARLGRMNQLLDRAGPHMTVAGCISILRDRLGVDDTPLGLGNRSAVNPLIASHSVVMDLTRQVIWVSASPHQLGAFVPFAFRDFQQMPDVAVYPADALLSTGGYAAYLEFQQGMEDAEQALREKRWQDALTVCGRIRTLNPENYQVYYVSARAQLALGDNRRALEDFQAAQARHPAFGGERDAIQAAILKLQEANHE